MGGGGGECASNPRAVAWGESVPVTQGGLHGGGGGECASNPRAVAWGESVPVTQGGLHGGRVYQ